MLGCAIWNPWLLQWFLLVLLVLLLLVSAILALPLCHSCTSTSLIISTKPFYLLLLCGGIGVGARRGHA
jgi:hypothetical protein